MHALLVTTGTDGDVYPFAGLGARLRSRGHRVTLVSNEHYAGLAGQLGLEFRSLVTNAETEAFLRDPDLWHPLKCGLAGLRWGIGLVPRQYALISELAKSNDAVLVANPGVLAARLVHDKLSTPIVTLLLQPWMIPSSSAPPLMPGFSLPRWAPRPMGSAYWSAVSLVGDLLVARPLNRIRASIGLKPIRRVFDWWFSPSLVIGLFSPWYGPPQDDWPTQVRLVGFPLDDGRPERELPSTVEHFLSAGPPPIAFTLGTGMMHAAKFFRDAVEACRTLGARGLLLTKFREQLPEPLPETVRAVAFAPFLKLFPRCAAVVHHGGIGTVAKALATGTPQLILPLAWDQPDNAARVRRLGVGEWLGRRRRGARDLAAALALVLEPQVKASCAEIGKRFAGEDAFDLAAGWVETQFACGWSPGPIGREPRR